MFGQETKKDSIKKLNPYVSVGLSMTSTNTFSAGSFPTVEAGVTGKNVSEGLSVGRANLLGIGEKKEIIGSYFFEERTVVSRNFTPDNKQLSYFIMFGAGSYGDFKHIFIEYGGGFSYSIGKFSYFVQATNWDNTNYITPGLFYVF